MNVLILGDVVGSAGCEYLRKRLPQLKKQYSSDIVVANGENAAEGNGILPATAQYLQDSGVDIITLGNHGLRRREIYDLLDQDHSIIRPANYHEDSPGVGITLYDSLKHQLCVINLQGSIYMQSYENPFTVVDRLLKDVPTKNIIVDFHAEATSEKLGMGFHLDGRVSAMVGTHTHVPTADAQILSGGTGYITDLGMCGSKKSVLGVAVEPALYRLRTNMPTRFQNEKEDIALSGIAVTIDESTGKCTKIDSFALV